ncbi:DUF1440 domain-containing protein [Niabella sp. CC-SYL272]|uniref:DUF1440 domain-containing protein n=1 Tax=Niabella agricola TaxID=2891571 RepID=UPI001F1E618E|nr:DUF1440 domain-containing protein [Niabella agricola]MCF3111987.1 DUF1440 domain-containing protein [Niabella agricola]
MKKILLPALKAGMLVGTLDILAAFLHYYLATGKNPLFIFRYIASALLGPAAFSGGTEMYIAGFLLHYLVALSFTLFFFWLYPRLAVLRKNPVATGIFYGLFIWSVMNIIIVPLSRIGRFPNTASGILISASILILAIGLPLAFITRHYYRRQQ